MAITKTGTILSTVGKTLFGGGSSMLGPIGLGLSAMSVSSGMNSAGGEAAGAAGGLATGNLASKAMKATGLGKLSLLGSVIGGMYGYTKASDFANKHMPIYKRGGTTTSESPSYANVPSYEK